MDGIKSNRLWFTATNLHSATPEIIKTGGLNFYSYLDDSLEYIDGIEKSLKGEENPVKNPDLLENKEKIIRLTSFYT